MAEERDGVVVEAVGLVAVEVALGGVWLGVQRGLAGECVGGEAWVDEVGAPGGGVAGHEEEGEEVFLSAVRRRGVMSCVGSENGGRVDAFVLFPEE